MNLNATILGQTISFILFVWFCMKYIWPPIIEIIEKRKKEIEDSFNLIKKQEIELSSKKNEIKKLIKNAHIEADNIIKKAYLNQLNIIEEAKIKALKEEKKIIQRAHLKIQMETNQINKELKNHVGSLSIIIAEKILKKSINIKDHHNLINQIISKF